MPQDELSTLRHVLLRVIFQHQRDAGRYFEFVYDGPPFVLGHGSIESDCLVDGAQPAMRRSLKLPSCMSDRSRPQRRQLIRYFWERQDYDHVVVQAYSALQLVYRIPALQTGGTNLPTSCRGKWLVLTTTSIRPVQLRK